MGGGLGSGMPERKAARNNETIAVPALTCVIGRLNLPITEKIDK